MVPVAKRIGLGRAIAVSVLLIGVLTGTLGLGYAYWHAKQTRRTTIGLFFQELARHNADKVSLMLAKEVEWIERLSTSPQVRAAMRQGTRLALDRPELQQWREAQHKYFQSLAMVNRQGRLVGGVTSETTRVHYAQQPWWPIVLGQGRSWAGDLLVDEKGRNHWEVAVPVSDDDGSVLGVLKAGIRTDDLLASVLRTQIGETGHVMLLGHGGHVLVCPILPPGFHTNTDALGAGRDRLGATWAEVKDDSHGSRDAIVGISRVVLPGHIVQERVWHVLVRQDPTETYGPAVALMWKLAGLWVGTIGLIALLGLGLARRIVQPLNALVERVGRLGEGQMAQRLDTGGQVEIAEIETLAASFNRMAERLEVASQETRRYVKELETTNVELAKSEEHYRTLWDHAVDSKLIVDAGGTVLDVNRRGEVKLGRRKEDVIGTSAADLFVEQDRLRFAELLGAVVETGKEESVVEIHVPTAAGSRLTMELDMLPIEKSGSVTSVLLQLSDVTEKKQLEQQLIRSEQLASLSQFASMFAHDIRNPLAGIKKTLEWLGHRQELRAKPVSRFFEELQFTTELLLGMINDMLDVYQESYAGLPLVSSSFSVGALLQEITHLFRLEAESKDVTLRLSLPDEEVSFVGDRRRFQRVAINLVHNALKFSPPKGVITLSARTEREANPEFGFAVPGAPPLVIQVEDEGPGLDSNELPHLFEMFFRKKDGRDLRIGRGLGLHFCRLVVEAHGGRIWAANRPTGGAVFAMALPPNGSDRCRSGW